MFARYHTTATTTTIIIIISVLFYQIPTQATVLVIFRKWLRAVAHVLCCAQLAFIPVRAFEPLSA